MSGGFRSAIRPHSNRELKRSSSCGISFGRAVARDDDLLLAFVEVVKGVEEFLFRPLPPGQVVDIVHQEHVDAAVLLPEIQDLAVLDVVDELVHELFGGDEEDLEAMMLAQGVVADGVHEVGLA